MTRAATVWTEGLAGWVFQRIDEERLDERLRIASDLHDDVQQTLTEILMIARCAAREVREGRAPSSDLLQLVRASEDSIESVRRVIHDLQGSPLGRSGLVPALRSLVRDLQLDWRLPIHAELATEARVTPGEEVALYQAGREGLVNALRHGSPRTITIRLEAPREAVALSVEDDGIGFDPAAIDPRTHFGLGLVSKRLRRLGGGLQILSSPGEGTRIRATLPARRGRGMKLGPFARLKSESPWQTSRPLRSSSRRPQKARGTSS
jgi:signal transduction histidine kinase